MTSMNLDVKDQQINQWVKGCLLEGKYANYTAAARSIGNQPGWTDEQKEEGRKHAEHYFSGAKGKRRIVSPAKESKTPSAAPAVQVQEKAAPAAAPPPPPAPSSTSLISDEAMQQLTATLSKAVANTVASSMGAVAESLSAALLQSLKQSQVEDAARMAAKQQAAKQARIDQLRGELHTSMEAGFAEGVARRQLEGRGGGRWTESTHAVRAEDRLYAAPVELHSTQGPYDDTAAAMACLHTAAQALQGCAAVMDPSLHKTAAEEMGKLALQIVRGLTVHVLQLQTPCVKAGVRKLDVALNLGQPAG